MKLDVELKEAGEVVESRGLVDPSQATTVRFQNGVPVTTDGPFAEVKEALAGYWIVEVSEERALEIASRVVAFIEHPMEVRSGYTSVAWSGPPPSSVSSCARGATCKDTESAPRRTLRSTHKVNQRKWMGLARFGLAMCDGADRGLETIWGTADRITLPWRYLWDLRH